MALDLDGGTVRSVRLAFGGVAATPIRARAAEDALVGQPFDEDAVARAQDALGRTLTPLSDHRGSKEYRLAVSQRLLEKFWWEVRA
jgi:xanthine dehydrogenase small subunit